MLKKAYKIFKPVLVYMLVFLILCLYYFPDRSGIRDWIFGEVYYGLHFVILGVWYWNIQRRLADPNKKRLFDVVMVLEISLILLQILHHQIWLNYPEVGRNLWYWYYIPVILIPLAILQMVDQRKRLMKLLWAATFVLLVGVLTNDLHELMYIFPNGPSEQDYKHGILFFIVLAWMLVVNGYTFVLCFRKHRRARTRENYLCLTAMIVIFIVGYVYVLTKPWFYKRSLFSMCQGYMMLYVLLMEYLLSSGLISTNNQHELIFRKSSLQAQIFNGEDSLIYASEKSMSNTKAERETAKAKGEVVTAEEYLLSSRSIHGGYIQWSESIHELLSQRQRFEEHQTSLLDEHAQLKYEKELKERQGRIEIQTALYENIDARLKDVFEKVQKELDMLRADPGEYDKRMPRVHLLGTYIKRYINLYILSERGPRIDTEELLMCIRESVRSLKIQGVFSDVQSRDRGFISGETALKLYEEFEAKLEEHLEAASEKQMNALMLVSRFDSGMLKLSLEIGTEDGENEEIVLTGPLLPSEGGV